MLLVQWYNCCSSCSGDITDLIVKEMCYVIIWWRSLFMKETRNLSCCYWAWNSSLENKRYLFSWNLTFKCTCIWNSLRSVYIKCFLSRLTIVTVCSQAGNLVGSLFKVSFLCVRQVMSCVLALAVSDGKCSWLSDRSDSTKASNWSPVGSQSEVLYRINDD